MDWICIIPARSGSKRLKSKNILPFGSTTLLGNTIQQAFKSRIFSEVLISTDNQRYEDLAIDYGAKSYGLRSPELSGDNSSTKDVISDLINNRIGRSVDGFTLLQCTSPFTTVKTIIEGTQQAMSTGGSCVSVRSIKDTYMEWMLFCSDGRLKTVIPELRYSRSQDSTRVYTPTGNLFASSCFHFNRVGSFYNTNASTYIELTDEKEMIDIDTEEDYKRALFILENK